MSLDYVDEYGSISQAIILQQFTLYSEYISGVTSNDHLVVPSNEVFNDPRTKGGLLESQSKRIRAKVLRIRRPVLETGLHAPPSAGSDNHDNRRARAEE